jgi:putative colanic acid biosynthesis acetyltransferase WcaF
MRSRYSDPTFDNTAQPLPRMGGATFAFRFRLMRLFWTICWTLFAAWTPSFLSPWRGWLLRRFGARIHATAIVRSSVKIWWPGNLTMGRHSSMGPGVICYNVAEITIDDFAIVSQRSHLCTGTHDVNDPGFPLKSRPIAIGSNAWVAAEAFVGPGVTIGEGAVLGARGVAFGKLEPWTIYAGNPARPIKERSRDAGIQ